MIEQDFRGPLDTIRISALAYLSLCLTSHACFAQTAGSPLGFPYAANNR